MKIIPVLAVTIADSSVFSGFLKHRGFLLNFSEMFFSKHVWFMLVIIKKCHLKTISVVYKVLDFLTGYIACRSCTVKLGFQFAEMTIGPQVQPFKVDLFLTRVVAFSLLLRFESWLTKHGSLGFSSLAKWCSACFVHELKNLTLVQLFTCLKVSSTLHTVQMSDGGATSDQPSGIMDLP